MNSSNKSPYWLLAATCLYSSWSSASSFQLLEQSPAHLGKAFAGTASDVNDATTVFFNPAAMSQLDTGTVSGGLNVIFTRSEFNDQGSTAGGNEGNTKESALVPNLCGVTKLGDRWSLGYGVSVPFGLASRFERDWIGRYLATESELEVINLNVTSAYQLNDQWSFGLGINFQKTSVTLENNIDSTFGTASSPELDSSVYIEGDDTDFVADVSVYWQPTDALAFGLLWRQGGSFDLEGDAEFDLNPACAANPSCANGLNTLAGDIAASVDLPDTTTLSGSFALSDHWALHADLSHTAWSSIQEVAIVNVGNGANLDTLELLYDDTVRISLGTTYAANQDWTWRFGVALDEAPQTNPRYNTPRIPDEDRTWLSAGFNYQWSESLSLDLAYTHILVQDAELDITTTYEATSAQQLVRGDFDSSVNIFGLQLNWLY